MHCNEREKAGVKEYAVVSIARGWGRFLVTYSPSSPDLSFNRLLPVQSNSLLPITLPHIPTYLGEVIDLLETLFNLQSATIARDPIDHRHHRLLHHLPADEALQHLCNLHALCSVSGPELLHLGYTAGEWTQVSASSDRQSIR